MNGAVVTETVSSTTGHGRHAQENFWTAEFYDNALMKARKLARRYRIKDVEELEGVALCGLAKGIKTCDFDNRTVGETNAFLWNAITFDVMNHIRKERTQRGIKARLSRMVAPALTPGKATLPRKDYDE